MEQLLIDEYQASENIVGHHPATDTFNEEVESTNVDTWNMLDPETFRLQPFIGPDGQARAEGAFSWKH